MDVVVSLPKLWVLLRGVAVEQGDMKLGLNTAILAELTIEPGLI